PVSVSRLVVLVAVRAPTLICTLSLHDALPISFEDLVGLVCGEEMQEPGDGASPARLVAGAEAGPVIAVEVFIKEDAIAPVGVFLDRKSTRLNSSHVAISYAVFCLKKKIRSIDK